MANQNFHAIKVKNWRKRLALLPSEDALFYDLDEKIFAVADGVTRDPSEFLPDLSTPKGKLEWFLRYPRISTARIAAKIFVRKFAEFIRDFDRGNRDEKAVGMAFSFANIEISEFSMKYFKEIDYLTNDHPGCVAAAAVIDNGAIHYGFLADSAVKLVSPSGEIVFSTPDEGPSNLDKYIWQDPELKGTDWRDPKARVIVRSRYRNNPENPHSFGVLTGEPVAVRYVRTGSLEFPQENHLLVHTDGLEKVVQSREFLTALTSSPGKLKRICQRGVKTEGALLHYQNK